MRKRNILPNGFRCNMLTVIEYLPDYIKRPDRPTNYISGYRVRCDCGNEKIIRGDVISPTKSSTKNISCGCVLRKTEVSVKYGAKINSIYSRYRKNAKQRKLSFDISVDLFVQLIQSPCHYCGIENSNVFKQIGVKGEFKYNGIDRVDNTKGYENGNCVACCVYCNRMKLEYTTKFFKEQIVKIYNNLDKF